MHQGVQEQLAPIAMNLPWGNGTWHEVAAYCNWLSDQEGISKDQWCYQPDDLAVALIASMVGQAGGVAHPWPVGWIAETRRGSGEVDVRDKMPAANHLQRTGYRLPTDAEWEYACRAGASTMYFYGQPNDLLGKYAWFAGNSKEGTHPVGTLKPNDFGLFDMLGNVWELCDDLFGKWASQRAIRGGCWRNESHGCRSSLWNRFPASWRSFDFGFRLARTNR
jgi:formylglycine-generating enzyme required for sulfatase activity